MGLNRRRRGRFLELFAQILEKMLIGILILLQKMLKKKKFKNEN